MTNIVHLFFKGKLANRLYNLYKVIKAPTNNVAVHSIIFTSHTIVGALNVLKIFGELFLLHQRCRSSYTQHRLVRDQNIRF